MLIRREKKILCVTKTFNLEPGFIYKKKSYNVHSLPLDMNICFFFSSTSFYSFRLNGVVFMT